MKRIYILLAMVCMAVSSMWAVDFKITCNSGTKALELVDAEGTVVEHAALTNPNTYNACYSYEGVAEGNYKIVFYPNQDKAIVSGKLGLTVSSDIEGTNIETCAVTTGVSNSGFVMGTDWMVASVVVTDNGGNLVDCTYGASTTANRITIPLFKGNTYVANFVPSEARQAENYTGAQASATVTSGSASSSVSFPQFGYYTVTVDKDVELSLGWKTGSPTNANGGTHFIPLNNAEPTVKMLDGGKKELTFKLNDKYYYIYNASMPGKRSLKGFFCYYANPTATQKVPELNLTAEDFGEQSPVWMNHDATAHNGSNVADIFLNINEKGYLNMNVGDERDVTAQRNWQLINSIMNYYVEPDYHYTVVNTDGVEDNSVITFDTTSTTWNPWVRMKAVGKGTAIVLVTYDACKTTIHGTNGSTSNFYFNDHDGEWSALWPENTGVYVVTVGQEDSKVITNMKNLEGMNVMTSGANQGKPTRYAAENVDAELDVFYFVEGDGYTYSFKPENAAKVEIAYPVIGETMTSYNGFGTEGVTENDGEYSILLKEGTNIVRLTDADGNATYQVMRAKKAQYEIVNETRPGMTPQAGDKVKIQYSGLYHPCNKLSGIYNMTGAIVYNGVANDNSIVGGSGQYNFGGTAAAQAFTITIPSTFDAAETPYYNVGAGMLRSSGFGSAYGAHRYFTREVGATPNMNAVVGTAYFGQLPEIKIPLMVAKKYGVKFNITPAEAEATVSVVNASGDVITPDADGYYKGIFGNYSYSIEAAGYKRVMDVPFSFLDETPETQTFDVALQAIPANGWDGVTMTEPSKNAAGEYVVTTGAELAWVANDINVNSNYSDNVSLEADIDLGNFDWKPMGGTSSAKAFIGNFKGNNHTVSGLYVNATSNYAGLFAYVKGNISDLTVDGSVKSTGNYVGGIAGAFEGVGYQNDSDWRAISNCVNHATVTGKQYVGGIAGQLATGGEISNVWNDGDITATTTTASAGHAAGITGYGNGWYTRILNAYNLGNVKANTYVGGIAGNYGSSAVAENLYNLGSLVATSTNATYANYCGSIIGSNTSDYSAVKNAYAAVAYTAEKNSTIVDAEAFRSGEVAVLLGEAFGQELGVDENPVLGGMWVTIINGEYVNPDKLPNTVEPGNYSVSGNISAAEGTVVPAPFQKYLGDYTSSADFDGDENTLTITGQEDESNVLTGYTIEHNQISYGPEKSFAWGGYTFNVCSVDGKTSGKLKVTDNGDKTYTIEDFAFMHNGRMVGVVKNLVATFVKKETKAANVTAEAVAAGVNAIYNMGGERTDALRRGVNILRKADGTVQKVLVK